MTCRALALLRLDATEVQVPRPGGGIGEQMTRYRGASSCGWASRSLGTLTQALSWARQHAAMVHPDSKLEPCEEDQHVIHRRTGYCQFCDADLWPEDKRVAWALRQMR